MLPERAFAKEAPGEGPKGVPAGGAEGVQTARGGSQHMLGTHAIRGASIANKSPRVIGKPRGRLPASGDIFIFAISGCHWHIEARVLLSI